MNEPLLAIQCIRVLERVAAETGLLPSQLIDVIQRMSHYLELAQKEAEFAKATQTLQQSSPDRSTH